MRSNGGPKRFVPSVGRGTCAFEFDEATTEGLSQLQLLGGTVQSSSRTWIEPEPADSEGAFWCTLWRRTEEMTWWVSVARTSTPMELRTRLREEEV